MADPKPDPKPDPKIAPKADKTDKAARSTKLRITSQVEGFRRAGARFVRLNPDRAYVERVLSGALRERPGALRIPDNDAGAEWTRANIRAGLEPEAFPMMPYMQAAVCELADRARARNWRSNLDAVLFPDAPSAGLPAARPPRPR